jgi:hypothetical protein
MPLKGRLAAVSFFASRNNARTGEGKRGVDGFVVIVKALRCLVRFITPLNTALQSQRSTRVGLAMVRVEVPRLSKCFITTRIGAV